MTDRRIVIAFDDLEPEPGGQPAGAPAQDAPKPPDFTKGAPTEQPPASATGPGHTQELAPGAFAPPSAPAPAEQPPPPSGYEQPQQQGYGQQQPDYGQQQPGYGDQSGYGQGGFAPPAPGQQGYANPPRGKGFQQIAVPDQSSLEQAVTSYVAQGFIVQQQTPEFTVLHKSKEFKVLWAVVGFLVCLLPFLVYLVMYANESDKTVEIRIDPSAPHSPQPAIAEQTQQHAAVANQHPGADSLQWSPDGHYWWDGERWRLAASDPPPAG